MNNKRIEMKARQSRWQRQLARSRMMLFTVLPLAAAASAGFLDSITPGLRLAYIILGFSLVIFMHELGHFVVARLCSVKCLTFSIGIGPRMCGWKKGVGFNFGKEPAVAEISKEEAKKAADEQVGVTFKEKTGLKGRKEVGDCDYRVSWLPLGGYVRMLGQDDMDPNKLSTDPHSFTQRPIWQRMCIVSAGVIMNVIFAAVCFSIIFSPSIGVDFPPAHLGTVQYDGPAWKAGLRPGDEITKIGDTEPLGFLEFTDVQMYSALSTGSDKLKFWVKKPGSKEARPYDIMPARSEVTGFLAIGVESLAGTKIVGDGAEYRKAFEEMAKGGDIPDWMEANREALTSLPQNVRITAVDDQDIHGHYLELYHYIQGTGARPVKLTLKSTKDDKLPPTNITFQPHLECLAGAREYPTVLGLAPRLIVGFVQGKSPAAQQGIKVGDRILAVGERTNPTSDDLVRIVKNSGGKPVQVVIERTVTEGEGDKAASKTETQTLAITPKLSKEVYRIGVAPAQDLKTMTFLAPADDSPAAALALPPGTTITQIDGQAVANWDQVYGLLKTKPAGTVNVTFHSASGDATKALPFAAAEKSAVDEQLHYQLGLHLEILLQTQKGANAGQAVVMGLDHTKKFILNVYMTLAGLFRRTVDASNLHGIVGITKVGYDVQERGPVWLWYVLAMVSVNLAVANFLPLPIVDGGLFLLLIVEKVRGKPLSVKIQNAIQTAGIVLLASLFLFVTWNDIKLF
jgi:regulator of sigma E protease